MSSGFTRFFSQLNKVLFLWILSFLFNIITLLIIYYKIQPGQQPLALDYNVLVGVTWYGEGKNLYFIPLIAFFITAANLILYRPLRNIEPLLARLCAAITFSVQLILLAAVIFLARVN